MKDNSFHQHMANTRTFLGTQGLFKTGTEAVEFKASVNWVNCSEFNTKPNRSYARRKVIATFASEWVSDTGRWKERLGDGL